MITNSKQLSLWKSVLNEELGPRWRKHLTHIAVTLECVTKGLKPAFLWDVGPSITPARLLHIVHALKTKELVSKDVHVVTLAGNALIVNLATFRETMNEFGSRMRVFVDVTGENPKSIEPGSATDKKCREMLASISESVAMLGLDETKCCECTVLPLEDSWCIPSLFGILSGYPFVYWYDPSMCDDPRCLNSILLEFYRVHAKTKRNAGEFELYSFTIPLSVMDAAGGQRCIDRWFERLTEKFHGHLWLSSLGIKGGRVVMPCVTL